MAQPCIAMHLLQGDSCTKCHLVQVCRNTQSKFGDRRIFRGRISIRGRRFVRRGRYPEFRVCKSVRHGQGSARHQSAAVLRIVPDLAHCAESDDMVCFRSSTRSHAWSRSVHAWCKHLLPRWQVFVDASANTRRRFAPWFATAIAQSPRRRR